MGFRFIVLFLSKSNGPVPLYLIIHTVLGRLKLERPIAYKEV